MLSRIKSGSSILLWLLFGIWFLLPTTFLVLLINDGSLPIDYESYHHAAVAIGRGESPYLSAEQSQQIWLKMHQSETQLLSGQNPSEPVFGPYIYPLTLALLIEQLHLNATVFVLILLLSIYGFGFLWLKITRANSWGLLLIMGSWDVLASFSGANVELLLLFATLLAAWLLWHQQGVWAAPLIAFVILVKPFYILFFVGFAIIMSARMTPFDALRLFALTALVILIFIGIDLFRWEPSLRRETITYLLHALDHQWFSLPFEEQTPMSIWNRTPMQGLVAAGISAKSALWLSFGLWLLFLAITRWCIRQRRLNFPITFALAFVLLYWGRSVGWGLIYLEIVVLLAIWPILKRWQQLSLLCITLTLTLSHWFALVLTIQGKWLRLFTLQSAEFPWETWTVLPLCWLLLISVVTTYPLEAHHARHEAIANSS